MGRTLSQPRPTLGARHERRRMRPCGARRPPLLALAATVAVVTAVLGGCNRIDSESETTAPFVWPEAPDHPRLVIEVDGAAGPGRIEIELLPELAPETIAKIRERADRGYYDGTTFHRVIPGFMIQGGDPKSRDDDPTNDGRGGRRHRTPDELGDAPFERGVVAMANRGRPDSATSQLFIMHADDRSLDGRYTVIGRVRDGMDVVDAITEVEIDEHGRWGPKHRPIRDVVMRRVRSVEAEGEEPRSRSARASQDGGRGGANGRASGNDRQDSDG